MKVAIVYDRVNKIGGAERVLESIHAIYPKATLFTSVYNRSKTPWAKKFKIRTSFLQHFQFLSDKHELIPYLMPLAFESFDFSKFDLVISVTSEAAKGIIVPPSTKHICICLTPTRYLWSGYKQYFKNPLLKFISYPLIIYLKNWDLKASQRPDVFVAISENVKMRIHKYYKRDSIVIFPPSDRLKKMNYHTSKVAEKDYFLVVSRFVDYKRVDLAIKVANKLKLPLVVIGEGKEWEKLDSIAGATVVFKGRVSDEDLWSYYKSCKAFIFPGEEDFGITMVEAQLAGKPVIAYKGGGAVEILKDGVTGAFFDKQTTSSLVEVLKSFRPNRYNSEDCKRNALRFSEEKFQKQILKVIESMFKERDNK